MDMAQNIIAQTIGVLVLIWMLGYTILRTQEAISKLSEPSDEDGSESETRPSTAQDDEPARRGTFAYAQQRRKDGKADSSVWGVVAALDALRKLPGNLRRRRTEEDSPGSEEARGRRGKPRKERSGRPWQPFDDEELSDEERQRRRRERAQDDEGYTHDEDETRTRWGRRRRRENADDGGQEDLDITVEEVPRYGPRDPELAPVVRELDPAEEASPPGPELNPSEPDHDSEQEPVLAEVIRIDSHERTQHVTSGTIATQGGQGLAAIGGDFNNHEIAMAAGKAVVKANVICSDHMAATLLVLDREIRVAAAKIDSLQASGIKGSVVNKWTDVLAMLQVARATAVQTQAQINEAHGLASGALAHQGAAGDPMQQSVAAAGRANVADKTSYYEAQ